MLEVEAKFHVRDLTAVRERLLAVGELKKGRVYERNVVYDTAVGTLRHNEQLLRLRQDEDVRLTFKGPAVAAQAQSEAKVREEIEVHLSDFDDMAQILGKLGFLPAITYEKYRETFMVGAVEVVLDELPYGDFVELEGPDEALRAVAEQLGLNWSRRLITNYLAMLAEVRAAHDLSFTDLTFENFVSVAVDGAALWGDALAG
ncbi:MAG: class IV adenylate cyclase [Anaerolineales bacterium]|nr:class IV adenylate cyclase [Anaerolineales bacterium]